MQEKIEQKYDVSTVQQCLEKKKRLKWVHPLTPNMTFFSQTHTQKKKKGKGRDNF